MLTVLRVSIKALKDVEEIVIILVSLFNCRAFFEVFAVSVLNHLSENSMDVLAFHVVGVLQFRGLCSGGGRHFESAAGKEISEFIAYMNFVVPPILLPPCQPVVEFVHAALQNRQAGEKDLGASLHVGVVGVPPVERGAGVCGDVRCAELCDKALQASPNGVDCWSGRLLEVFWSQFGERFFKFVKHPRDAIVEGIIYLKVVEQLVERVINF
ncbi:hypothetical protein UY3 15361, putative [Babesia ovata]|uniref:Uncharacterized protein n=1 Tax=Babesia ovata TaxID=189622 RepID=A0A2H6K921_9APIC|nr:hypothetical protein UY3 15361, putative [Babesia ovata]GBE59478.1 hypothetical protein UY3 15361, putative [Babesia ovata]